MGTTVQRKMYVNQPAVRDSIVAEGEREARMGHSNRTARRSYVLPLPGKRERVEPEETASDSEDECSDDKENEELPQKRQKQDERTALETEVEEFADGLIDGMENEDLVYEDEIDGVSRF